MNLRRAVEKIVNTTGLDPLKHHFFVDVGCSFKRTPSHLDCLGSVLETMTSSIQVQFQAVATPVSPSRHIKVTCSVFALASRAAELALAATG